MLENQADSRITLENVTYAYPGAGREALAGIDADFERGRMCAVLGRNGSGKSTLARCLNGLLVPTAGRVVACGVETSDPDGSRDVRRLVAMVFQDPDTQMVAATVEEEVAFGPENLGLPREEIRRRVDRSLAMAGIEDLARRQPQRLSQGQKQLVAIAGALAMEPAFLVSDESTSMLDYRSRVRVLELLDSLRSSGVGVVHVTHFLEEATLADRVLVLDGGRPVASGTPAGLLSDPARVRAMGLDPLAVTVVIEELGRLGHPVAERVLGVKELLTWLYA